MQKKILTSVLLSFAVQLLFSQIHWQQYSVPILHFNPYGETKVTHGTRFFLTDYYKGAVTIRNDSVINADVYYNFDELTGNLYLTDNGQAYYLIDKQRIKSISLFAPDKTFAFEKEPPINTTDLFEVITKGPVYSIFKLPKVPFKKSDYHTTGLIEGGNKFDEYIDQSKYFVVNNKTNIAKQFYLEKHSMAGVFGEVNVQSYFSTHRQNDLNEEFLLSFASYLND
jgi:hypothetical protein